MLPLDHSAVHDNADLSEPPVWRYRVAPSARPAGGHTHHQRSPRTPELHRSPPRAISLKRNCRSAAQPARAGRSDRPARLAHEEFGASKDDGESAAAADLSAPCFGEHPVAEPRGAAAAAAVTSASAMSPCGGECRVGRTPLRGGPSSPAGAPAMPGGGMGGMDYRARPQPKSRRPGISSGPFFLVCRA